MNRIRALALSILIFILFSCVLCYEQKKFSKALILKAGAHTAPDDFENDDVFNDSKREMVFGRDRELFYASIDFKWIFDGIRSPKFWRSIGHRIIESLANAFMIKDSKLIGHKNALELWSLIRGLHKSSTLKCFQGSLEELESYSRYHGKPVLLYVENGSLEEPSSEAIAFRLALSDPALGAYINENFVFQLNRYSHRPTKRLIEGLENAKDLPVLIVLAPSYSFNKKGLFTKVKGTNLRFKEVRRFGPSLSDIKMNKIFKFLQRSNEQIGPKLINDKKTFESCIK